MKPPRLENVQQLQNTREKLEMFKGMIEESRNSDHPAREISVETLSRRAAKLQAEIDEFGAYHGLTKQTEADRVKQAS